MNLIEAIQSEYLKESVPSFQVGDTVKVHVKVVEGKRERIQIFEGIVIKTKRTNRRNFYSKKNLLRHRR